MKFHEKLSEEEVSQLTKHELEAYIKLIRIDLEELELHEKRHKIIKEIHEQFPRSKLRQILPEVKAK